ncbi:hypothetical protein ACH3VR_00080 [Microbacterium sp. B2969]|uniref:Uncharacterized protein n=1 Tax=Microbacterium alkaliflavum TaxID=3248839 RepID=A0ABW7Q2L1_9MICO
MVASAADRAPVASRGGIRDASPAAWGAIAAWGAGLIHLALGAGAVTAGHSPAGMPLVALGAAALAWGAAALARGRVVIPRAAVGGVLLALIAGAVALGLDPARISVVAVAAASALLVVVGIGCGLALRGREAGRPGIPVIILAAVIVAAIATPTLAATEAGRFAPDHGSHGIVVTGHTH